MASKKSKKIDTTKKVSAKKPAAKPSKCKGKCKK